MRSSTNRNYIQAMISVFYPLKLINMLFAFIFLFTSTISFADTPKQETNYFDQNLSYAGVTYELAKDKLNITIDQNKAPQAIRLMELTKAIDVSSVKTDMLQKMPITYTSGLIGLFFSGAIIREVYLRNHSLDSLRVSVSVISPDSSGKSTKQACYSFDFNRKLFQQINWENFLVTDLVKIAPNFNFSDWCSKKLREEDQAHTKTPAK